MSYAKSPAAKDLLALKRVQPRAWKRKVRAALRRHAGEPNAVAAAAGELDVSRAQLYRWLREAPELRDGIDLPTQGTRTDLGTK